MAWVIALIPLLTMFNRSRRNLACWFALSMGSILIVFACVIYYREVQSQMQVFDQELARKTKVMAARSVYQMHRQRWRVYLEDVPIMENNTLSLDSELAYGRWYNSEKNLVRFFGTPAPGQLTAAPGFVTIKINSNQSGGNYKQKWLRQVTLPVVQDRLLIGYLQVAIPLTSVQEDLERTRLFLTLGVPVTLGLIGLTGWLLGGLAMQPIRRSYEQLQRFTADASHELRAPLAAIMSNAQVGLISPRSNGSQQRQRLENIVETTKSMSALISNLLFLARHEGKLAPNALKSIDLAELLQPLIDDYTRQAQLQNLKFITHLPQYSITLSADPELLQQAIRNLLNNSFKYTPEGGTVHLRLFIQSRRIMIEVEDNGIGIPPDNLPHIFERFYRVDTVRSRSSGGFGLGLSIAQQIVQAHGGQIAVKSLVGHGTTFQIELPLR